jgi:outer membrane protein
VGRKSAADVAQVESQKAEADYELTRQQNLYASAILELKKAMNYPLSDSIKVVGDGCLVIGDGGVVMGDGNNQPLTPITQHPELQVARYRMQASKHEWHQARASLYPSLSLSAGLSTTYYKTLHNDAAETFRNQMKNNMGEYLGVSVNIPLFNRLRTLTGIRKAKNNYRIAQEAYDQKQLELTKLSTEAWNDWQGYQKQTIQMQKKVQADSLSYQLTRRQFEEGLSTAIDVYTTSAQLLNSKATLLQCQLMAEVKQKLVRYYRGECIWE